MLVALTAACGDIAPTGDTSADEEAAQSLMPTIGGYTSIQTDSVQDAIASVTGAGSVATGNVIAAAAIARIDAMIDCYRGVGAVDARMFASTSLVNGVPVVGALAIVNQTRLVNNFLQCAADPGGMRAQGANQVCTGSGQLEVNGESIAYVYAASNQVLCTAFDNHFNTLRSGG